MNIHQISERQLSNPQFSGQFNGQCDPTIKRQVSCQINHQASHPPIYHQTHLSRNNFKNQQNIYQNVKPVKTGWLMRKGHNGRWFRHWFVLRDTLLTYYRDQPAELNSLLDGVFDLALVKRVHLNSPFTVNQNSNLTYWPFVISTWNGEKQHELAALSSECRDEWIKLIVDSQSQISSIAAIAADFSLKEREKIARDRREAKQTGEPTDERDARRDSELKGADTKENEMRVDLRQVNGAATGIDQQQVCRKQLTCDTGSNERKDSGKR